MKRELTKQRLDKLINEDLEVINEPTRAAAQTEFERVAREYFETDNVTLSIKRVKSGTDVSVSFRATRIKNFNVLK